MNPQLDLNVTPVFLKNWNAINAKTVTGERRYKYIINRGSSRSSKTSSIIDCLDLYARTERDKRITAWRDTKTDCVKTVLEDYKRHLGKTKRWLNGFTFNETRSIASYKRWVQDGEEKKINVNTFEIHGTDDIVTVHGLNQSVAWMNEPYKIARGVFDQIDQRTEDFIIIDYNPTMGHWVEDIMKDKRAIVIDSTFLDNAFCPPEQKIKILSYQPISMCSIVEKKLLTEKQAKEYDIVNNPFNFSTFKINELSRCRENERKNSASVYNWSVYGLGLKAEKPNRIFRFKEISLDEFLALDVPSYYYSDWGAVDPWAVGQVKYYDGALYVREKNYKSENVLRAEMEMIALEQINGVNEGIVTWLFNQIGIPYNADIICDTNRPQKILALRAAGWEYAVGLVKKETGTGKGAIVDGVDLVNNLTVYYTSDSPNIKYEQENYSRDTDSRGIVLDEPIDADNHHMDGIRYVASYLEGIGIIQII